MIQNIEKILDFREKNPVEKGKYVKTNDPNLLPVQNALISLKKEFEELFNSYEGEKFNIEISKGAAKFPNILHISILPKGQKVSDGIYTVLCFDKKGRGFVVGVAESVTNRKNLKCEIRDSSKIDVDGASLSTKYNNCFYNPKEFYRNQIDVNILKKHIYSSMKLSLLFCSKQFQQLDTADYSDEYDPNTTVDSRQKNLRLIVDRNRQANFKTKLMKIYEQKCAITGCNIKEILEAAHIDSYKGYETNDITNGLILRADIHRLFDSYLITIDANSYQIRLNDTLSKSEYSCYTNKIIDLPKNRKDYPSKKALQDHNKKFEERIAHS